MWVYTRCVEYRFGVLKSGFSLVPQDFFALYETIFITYSITRDIAAIVLDGHNAHEISNTKMINY